MKTAKKNDIDLDNDGVITEKEIVSNNLLVKVETQTRLAYISIWSMVILTIFLFLPVFPDTRIIALGDVITLFYLGNSSIVGAYMGVTAYMSVNQKK
jgi:hypothetical protein